jgi:predicted DNA-binding transcriptional regulator AlpA
VQTLATLNRNRGERRRVAALLRQGWTEEEIAAEEAPRRHTAPDDPTKNPAIRRRIDLLLEEQTVAPEVPPRLKPPVELPPGADPLLDSTRVRLYCGGVSEMTLFRWIQKRGFPPPDLRVGQRRFWRVSTVEAWIERQILRPTA